MMLIGWIALFVLGYALIFFSAEFLVEEIIEYLEHFKVSPVVFGIVFLGIELEESSASIFAAANGLPFLSMGNLIGNSIMAVFLTFSIPFFILQVTQESFPSFYPSMLILAVLNILISFLFPPLFTISAIIGLVLFLLILGYSFHLQNQYRSTVLTEPEKIDEENEDEENEGMDGRVIIARVILGFILILIGGQLLTSSAEQIILQTNLSETFFGLIIMAFVTNGEELFLMISSLRRGQYHLGLSAQMGKLLWNLSLVFGISGLLISSFAVSSAFVWLTWLLLVTSIILFYLIRYQRFSKISSILFFVIFLVFIGISLTTL